MLIKSIYNWVSCLLCTVVWNALKFQGKKLRLKNPLLFPSKSEGIYLQILMESACKKWLLNALIIWFNYLQKVNAKCPQISDGKIFFWSFKIRIKSYLSKSQNFFFIRNLRALCIYFLQVLESEYEGIQKIEGITFCR